MATDLIENSLVTSTQCTVRDNILRRRRYIVSQLHAFNLSNINRSLKVFADVS